MKTNRAARRLLKIQFIMVCLTIATIAGLDYSLSQTLAARVNQISAGQTTGPQVWNPTVGISDLMAAAR